MTAPRQVDVFWSMQSPYCYCALDRLLALASRSDVTVALRPVRPGVLRAPERFVGRDEVAQRYFSRDAARTAAFLGLPYARPTPSPVVFMEDRFEAEREQPRIGWLYDLFLAATAQGAGLAFIDHVMRLIWDGRTGWDQPERMSAALANAGLNLDALSDYAAQNQARLAEILAENEAAMHAAGHWGVPLFVLDGEPFYGQDRMDQLVWRLQSAS